jgi:hypothetical protein
MTTRHALRRHRPIVAATLAFLFLAARPALAVVVSFADFSDTTGLALNGSAAATTTSDGTVLRIVPAMPKSEASSAAR